MKNMSKLAFAAVIALFLFSTISYSQVSTKEVTFTVNKKGDKFFSKITNGVKTIEILISGLTTQDEIDAFTTKFNKIKGVEKFTVSQQMVDNKWPATLVFIGKTTKTDLKNLLIEAGVSKIIIDGNAIKAAELDTYDSKSNNK